MEIIQNTRKSMPRRIAVAIVAMVAVIAGVGVEPAALAAAEEPLNVITVAGGSLEAEAKAELEAKTSEGMHSSFAWKASLKQHVAD